MNGQQTAKPRLIAGGVQAGFAAPSKAFENCPAWPTEANLRSARFVPEKSPIRVGGQQELDLILPRQLRTHPDQLADALGPRAKENGQFYTDSPSR
jgi:hypothetical protein